ncbi:MAG: recombinase family protein, partial [Clostridia bacterium]|nr:recombinase family protein [Clostridia bacterium]
AERKPAVGVFFESEAIFSLNDDSQMALTFQATMADEESHTRSRSMETSLRMRLDHGLPLTPKLLGYSHDADGNLIINPEEAPTVKLAFYMYLFGYSSGQIAKAFIALERKSYLGNTTKWTSGSIIQILRNERHCGDVITRKTYTPSYHDHLSKKNFGDRPQSHYSNHHEAIVSKADYIAVQHMIENARFGNRSFIPELRVIDSGILKGFVRIHPRWANFKEGDYFQAAVSVYDTIDEATATAAPPTEIEIEVSAGDFDLRSFEVARAEFFDTPHRPYVTFADRKIKFNTDCIRKLGSKNYVELLINPITKKIAIRPTDKDNRQGVYCSTLSYKVYYPKDIPAAAFFDTIYRLFGWNTEYKYKINGAIYEKEGEIVFIFDAADCETYFKSYMLPRQETTDGETALLQPISALGNYIKGYPEEWLTSFGKPYYFHERSVEELENQSELDWQLRIQGQLFETGKRINVTPFEELRRYIRQELSGISLEEVTDESI